MIPRIAHPWLAGRYPYELFDGTGITSRTSLGDLLDAALELEAQGKMLPEVRIAYDAIRAPVERLATDFFLFNAELCDPTALAKEAVEKIS